MTNDGDECQRIVYTLLEYNSEDVFPRMKFLGFSNLLTIGLARVNAPLAGQFPSEKNMNLSKNLDIHRGHQSCMECYH